jgi:hypothetical protein
MSETRRIDFQVGDVGCALFLFGMIVFGIYTLSMCGRDEAMTKEKFLKEQIRLLEEDKERTNQMFRKFFEEHPPTNRK